MKFIKYSLVLLIVFLMNGCKKAESNSGTTKTPPSNLTVSVIISTDGTGKVLFTATADNAATYSFEFGNGAVKTESSGVVNYQYTEEGSNTYTITVTATSNTGLSIKKSIDLTVSVVRTLFWSDEFNTDGAPDPAKWGYDLGDGCPDNCGFGNNELEWYTKRPENVIVEGGVLKIKAIKENLGGKLYTSTRMLSKDKFAFKYGKVEARAKLPAGVGTWPAIWMLGSDVATVGWPACGEIDIMERLGRDLNKIYGTLHYPGHSGGNADGGTKLIQNATTEFHIYTLDWTATSIKILVDGQLIHSVANSPAIPFNHDFFFNFKFGNGRWIGGPVDPSFTNGTMEVDYIRIYK